MSIKFTEDQEKAINEKGNILVAAAAGSGKTAVLVERVIRNILENNINISEMLVVTFTNAAASEMREKILDVIYKKLESEKNNMHLQKQLILMADANISTIHAFCLKIIKENFYILGISPNIKMGSNEELEILKNESMDEIFEEEYIEKRESFLKYIFKYAGYRDDKKAKSLIFQMQNFLNTIPFYDDYILKVKENLLNENFLESEELKEFLSKIKDQILDYKNLLENIYFKIKREIEFSEKKEQEKLINYSEVLLEDINYLEKVYREKSWDKLYNLFKDENFVFKTNWPRNTLKLEIADEGKDIRNIVKANLKKMQDNIFYADSKEIYLENLNILESLEEIFYLTKKYEERYFEKKKEEKILDFSDLEKLALKILVKKADESEIKNEKKENIIDEKYIKTDIARRISKNFKEIQIDEYQDINTMQEYILNSVSSGNVFQVGDIKQSIYMFRNANPNLFLKKYIEYIDENDDKDICLDIENKKLNQKKLVKEAGKRIRLFKNFRSRSEVLDYTNDIFSNIMSKELGDIDYTKEEYLNLGYPYDNKDNINYLPELVYIEKEEKNFYDEELTEEEKRDLEDLENAEYEAIYIKNEIKRLIDEKFQVLDKKTGRYRDIKYKDIAIFLRSVKGKSGIMEKILDEAGIPVYADESDGFLDSKENQKIIAYLKIIDNPNSDIDILAVLRSYFFEFTLNEIIYFVHSTNKLLKDKKKDTDISIYKKIKIYIENFNDDLSIRLQNFLDKLKEYKDISRNKGITNLLNEIIVNTGYIKNVLFMKNGFLKKANLELFIKKAAEYEERGESSLLRFISFLEKVKLNSTLTESAKIISEDENVVKIMTMHKSKGLEYPVVFLSNMDKKINEMDLKSEMIMDEKLGVGLNFIDDEKRYKYTPLYKRVIIEKKRNDLISEELRILYVALTRAREKLYITSVVKTYKEYIEALKKDALGYFHNEKISKEFLKSKANFRDFISINKLYNKKKNNEEENLDIDKKYIEKIVNISELNLEEHFLDNKSYETIKDRIKKLEDFKFVEDNEIVKYIKEIYKSEYNEYESKEEIKSKDNKYSKKMSVSKIISGKKERINYERPKLMQEKNEMSGKERGDIFHGIFADLDFRKIWNEEDIKRFFENKNLNFKENINYKEFINPEIYMNFFNSDIYIRITKAKEIHKEENFYSMFSKNEIENLKLDIENDNEKDKEQNILIQGIIDLYFIDENDEIVLIDYKTDNPKNKENLRWQLKENYTSQLKLYALILEKLYKKKVKEIYIYSTTLGEFIEIKN